MKRVLHIILLSCSRATELIEKDIYFKLSVVEKIQLTVHAGICGMCHRYRKHSRLLHQLMIKLHLHDHEHEPPPIPGEQENMAGLKEKIISRLEEK
jgi:hypothetical protein